MSKDRNHLSATCHRLRKEIMKGSLTDIKDQIIALEEHVGASEKYKLEERLLLFHTLAKYYRKQKNYQKAADFSLRALHCTKKVERTNLELIIDTYLDYAKLELDYGQQSNARIELAKLLALLDKEDYNDPLAYGVIYQMLGKISFAEENMKSGLAQYEKALQSFQRGAEVTHPLTVEMIHLLSDRYVQVENYEKAIALYKPLFDIYEQTGEEILAARTLLKMGEIYFYIHLKEARKIITEVVKRFTKIYEEEHLDLTKAIFLLAEIDENLNNYPRSINYYKRALEQLHRLCAEDHFLIVYAYSKIGTLSLRTFQVKQAKQYLEKGLRLSKSYPKIRQQFLYALGKIYSDEKSYKKAQKVFSEFMGRLEKEGRKNSLAYGNTLQSLAYNELRQENFTEAARLYEEALAIYKKLPRSYAEKGLAWIRLSNCYEQMETVENKRIEKGYEEGLKWLQKTKSEELIEEGLLRMITFCDRIGKTAKRKVYEDLLVKLQKKKESALSDHTAHL